MDEEVKAVRTSIEATSAGLSVPVTATVDRDVPAAGEALVHGAQCSLLIVPRPATES